MKAVILAGGRGTRLTEETVARPKPMVEVGGRPLLWHICRSYAAHGITEFVICCGYKGYIIKEFFANYFLHMSNVTFDLRENRMEVHQTMAEPWRITLVDTGLDTQTGGRLKRVAEYVADEDFCCTYGDGVANVDITALVDFHRAQGRLATVTAVQPPGRFGALQIEGDRVNDVPREAPRRRQLDQRRVLRAVTEGPRHHRRRRDPLRTRTARTTRRQRRAVGLSAPWLLATRRHACVNSTFLRHCGRAAKPRGESTERRRDCQVPM